MLNSDTGTTGDWRQLAGAAALLLLLATLWGGSYTLIRIGVQSIPPVTLIAARTALAATLLWTVALSTGHAIPRRAGVWRQFCVQGALNSGLPFTLIAWAETRVGVGVAVILNSTSPLFAVLGTLLIGRYESVPSIKIFGVLCGLVGVIVVVGTSGGAPGGELLAELALVAASISYAGAALYGRRFRHVPPLITAAGSMTCASALLVPTSLLVDAPWTLRVTPASVGALLILAMLSTALAYVIYFRLIRTLGPIGITSQAFLRVPVGVALGALVMGDSLNTRLWIGLSAVVIGVGAMTLPSAGVSR